MAPELQRPTVTEIQVRMDCNGCVQRIKKTLNNIDGINDMYFDLPQQKITIIGRADPEYMITAIRRTKRNATFIYSPETEPTESPEQQAPDATQKQEEDEQPEKLKAEPLKDPPPPQPPPSPPPEQPPEVTAPPKLTEDSSSWQSQSRPESEDEGEVHECVGQQRERYHRETFVQEPPVPIYVNVTHCYNTYQRPPYVTEYDYVRSSSRHTHYSRMEHYSAEYYNENESFTSMFSDENPNSCTIV